MILLTTFSVLVFFNLCDISSAWDTDELEVFDVVEEVNQNFYELMGISQAANSSDIKKAFRRLSLQLHPDKNSATDADEQFRKLVAVYDILRDRSKRERYDSVLLNGLPNWRSAVYYYRHVRKMGLLEMSIILFIVITIGQYLVAWAAYFEKRYTYEQVLGSKLQRMQKKNRKGKMDVPHLAEILEKIPSPSMWNTLPFQLPRWTLACILGIPAWMYSIYIVFKEMKHRREREGEVLAQEMEEMETENVPRGPRRRRAVFTLQERNDKIAQEYYSIEKSAASYSYEKPKVVGGLWMDDDILELIKLVKKYPGGTPDRWEKIAELMNRTVHEVTHMARKVKDEGLKPGQPDEQDSGGAHIAKVKTRAEAVDNVADWSQEQQRALEVALIKYPKGSSLDRWDKIANGIPEKTKEECQIRYRQLVGIVKKRQHTH